MLHHDENCLFCKIVAGQIPCRKVYEDEQILAFHDINPAAPVHFLIIPKTHIASVAHAQQAHAPVLAAMLLKAPQLALEQGCKPYPDGGFKLVMNTGAEGGQVVHHMHLHVLGGEKLSLKV